MTTKFQIEYLSKIVKDEIQRCRKVIIESVRPQLNKAASAMEKRPMVVSIRKDITKYYELKTQIERLSVLKNEVKKSAEKEFAAFFKTDLVQVDYIQKVYQASLEYSTEEKALANLRAAVEAMVLPGILQETGKTAEIEGLDEKAKNIEQKIMLAMNMKALREALKSINEAFGLTLEI